MALAGAWGTFYSWYVATREDLFFEKASMLFPAFCVLGIAATIFPNYKEERIARGEDISGLQGWKLLTPRWRWVLIVALIVGFGNYLLIRSTANWE